MIEAAIIILALFAGAVIVAAFVALRPQKQPSRIDIAQSDDERRLAATTDPARRAKLERRMAERMKGQ